MDNNIDLETARHVLQLEKQGLEALSHMLDDSFTNIISMLMDIKGRIVVTGMGKSGHIARKIASTLASTGSPALFVHPGEASHGDLGMITKQDAVIGLSNSGESHELSDMIGYTRRFRIPFVAITRNLASTLGRSVDYVLLLPDVPEACWIGLAPTTSSLMMLALGDALAVTLLRRRGFTPEDFSTFHPQGKLGQILLRIENIMHPKEALPLVTRNTLMSEVILVMSQRGFGCVGVIDDQQSLVGMITDGDLRRHMQPNLLNLSAASVMTLEPKTIRPQAIAAEALQCMNHYQITSLFVTTGEYRTPIGIVHLHDCLRYSIV